MGGFRCGAEVVERRRRDGGRCISVDVFDIKEGRLRRNLEEGRWRYLWLVAAAAVRILVLLVVDPCIAALVPLAPVVLAVASPCADDVWGWLIALLTPLPVPIAETMVVEVAVAAVDEPTDEDVEAALLLALPTLSLLPALVPEVVAVVGLLVVRLLG